MPRNVSIGVLILVVVATVAALVAISFVSKIRYLTELQPPQQYNHPYHGRVVERIMPVAEVRALCTSVGASGRFVACAWVSDGVCHIVLPNDERALRPNANQEAQRTSVPFRRRQQGLVTTSHQDPYDLSHGGNPRG